MSRQVLYRSYALGMKVLGFERSIADSVSQLELPLPAGASILDVACGTGVIGLTLMRGCLRSTLVATDVSTNLLRQTRRNAIAQGIDHRVTIAVSDISHPEVVAPVDVPGNVALDGFDVVATGAAIGYSRDQERTIHSLLDLVKPGGCFLNFEMDESLIGQLTSRRYEYNVMPLSRMERVIERKGFAVKRVPVRAFPARLTRTCYVARRPG